MVIRTTRETKTTADSETKTVVTRITKVHKITVGSETKTVVVKTASDQNLPVVDSETAQAAKALVQADSRAAEAALDKTIINKETNS